MTNRTGTLADKDRSMSDDKKLDLGKLTVEALNRATTSPEFTARYKAWLDFLGPKLWTPAAKADYEAMSKEDIDVELVAKYRAELEASRFPPASDSTGSN
jgi:hypothetical protein